MRPSTRVGGAGLLALVATYGIGRQAYGLFVPAFRETFGLGLDVLGFYASAGQIGYLLATVGTGVLAARYGPRVPVVAGGLVLAAGSVVIALAPGPVLLAVGVVAVGTSAGGAWGPFSDAVEQQVPEGGRRRALALVNAGSPVGLILASVLSLVAGEHWRLVWWAFAAVGVAAAVTNAMVLVRHPLPEAQQHPWPGWRWFVSPRTRRLYAVTFGASLTSGAYFSYAPDTAQAAGLAVWIGPAMWAVLGAAGAAVGVFGGGITNRFGLRLPLRAMLVLLAGGPILLLVGPGSTPVALASAALFGIGFTTAYALVVIWSQLVFRDRPTIGFTATIVCIAIGFSVGPSLFGVLATQLDRPAALVGVALPSLLAALVHPRTRAAAHED